MGELVALDATTFLLGLIVCVVALMRAALRPPDEVLPLLALAVGVLANASWQALSADMQGEVLAGAALGLMAMGGRAGFKTYLRPGRPQRPGRGRQ